MSGAAAADRLPRTGLLFPGIVTLAALAVLIGLGLWQLERKAWKESLIETLSRRLSTPAIALPPKTDWPFLNPADDEFRRVSFRAQILPGREGRVFTTGTGLRDDIKAPGYFAFAPTQLADGSVVVVNRGYVANARPVASLSPIGVGTGTIELTGVMRWPEAPSAFVAAHDVRDDLWLVRDHLAMAATYGWGNVAPFYIEQEAPVPPGGVPRPGALKVNLRNEHLNYALTWFGLAAVLAIVFAVWAGSRRREVSASATRSR